MLIIKITRLWGKLRGLELKRYAKMKQNSEGRESGSASVSTRREFIRKVGKKTLYTVPLIVTFAKADLATAESDPIPSGFLAE